jgi:hypothetical protein
MQFGKICASNRSQQQDNMLLQSDDTRKYYDASIDSAMKNAGFPAFIFLLKRGTY